MAQRGDQTHPTEHAGGEAVRVADGPTAGNLLEVAELARYTVSSNR